MLKVMLEKKQEGRLENKDKQTQKIFAPPQRISAIQNNS